MPPRRHLSRTHPLLHPVGTRSVYEWRRPPKILYLPIEVERAHRCGQVPHGCRGRGDVYWVCTRGKAMPDGVVAVRDLQTTRYPSTFRIMSIGRAIRMGSVGSTGDSYMEKPSF